MDGEKIFSEKFSVHGFTLPLLGKSNSANSIQFGLSMDVPVAYFGSPSLCQQHHIGPKINRLSISSITSKTSGISTVWFCFKTQNYPIFIVTCILSLLGSKGVFICNVAWKGMFCQNRQVSNMLSVIWTERELLIEAHLVFSASALNLVVALFQPGWGHLLAIGSGNVAVTNLPEQEGHHVTSSLFLGGIQNLDPTHVSR